jgi:hypothetical protein
MSYFSGSPLRPTGKWHARRLIQGRRFVSFLLRRLRIARRTMNHGPTPECGSMLQIQEVRYVHGPYPPLPPHQR